MVLEGEAQPDSPVQLVFSKCRKVKKIACESMAERQQDHFGSLMATGARGVARGQRQEMGRRDERRDRKAEEMIEE